MIKFSLIKFDKIFKKANQLFEASAKNSFLFFLTMILIVFLFGLIIFYQYIFLVENKDIVLEERKLLRLDQEKQARVLEEWQKRNEIFYNTDIKVHLDPFFNID